MRALKPIIPLKDLIVGQTYLEHVPSEMGDPLYDLMQCTIVGMDDRIMLVYLNGDWPITKEKLEFFSNLTFEQLMDGDDELYDIIDEEYYEEGMVIYHLNVNGVEIENDYVGQILFMALDEGEEIIYKKSDS